MKNNEVIPDTIELSSQLINALRGLTNPKQIEDLINQGALLELKKLTPQAGIPNNPLTILVSNYFPHNNQIDTFNTVFKLLVDKGEDINDTIHQTTLLSLCIQKKLDEAVNNIAGATSNKYQS